MYFLLAGVVHRFVYLKYGLAAVLVFVGAKMMLVDVYKVPVLASLAVIAVLIGGGETSSGSIDITAPTGSVTVLGTLRSAGALRLAAGTNAAGEDPGIEGDIVLVGAARSDGSLVLATHGRGEIRDASDAATHLFAVDAALEARAVGSESNPFGVDVNSLSASVSDGIYLDAAGDIALGRVAADSAAIAAGGTITDDGDAQTRLSAQSATLSALSIGGPDAGAAIDTAVDTLSATASAGGVYIDEVDDLILAAVGAASSGGTGGATSGGMAGTAGDVVLRAGGAIRDDGDDSTYIAGGRVVLAGTALGAAGTNGAEATTS
jgi:hypothetical protein